MNLNKLATFVKYNFIIGAVLSFLIVVCVTLFIVAVVIHLTSCGLATDSLSSTDIVEVEGPTKYKKLVTGLCSFKISAEATIPGDWGHWRQNMHQFAVISNHPHPFERARYSTWDDLYTYVDCGFCTYGIDGILSVMDSKDDLVPWGCGVERPPLNVQQIIATYVSPGGGTSIREEDKVQWEDTPLKTYEHRFVPELTSRESFCEGDLVLLNLDDACEVLVEAGVMEKIPN